MNRGLRSILNRKRCSMLIKQYRFYLSEAYHCEDAWRDRLKDPLVKDIKPTDFYFDLLRKFKREGKISAIDADLFLNRIEHDGKEPLLDEMEEILRVLRRSSETAKTLDSTPHAVVRNIMKHDRTDLLLRMLSDTTNYGIFPCYYMANLLMNHFLIKKDYTASARVASGLMLQEDYGPPLTQALALYSCYKFAFNQESNASWVGYTHVEEPEEEVKVIVSFIRNPYFDDHFDIKVPNHIVGKTLAWMVLHNYSDAIKHNTKTIGWAMYQKYTELDEALNSVLDSKSNLDTKVVEILEKSVADCQDGDLKDSLEKLIDRLKADNLVRDIKIEEQLDKIVRNSFASSEQNDIENQIAIYKRWSVNRKAALEKEIERLERIRLIQEIQDKKEYLKKREEVLFFFDHKLQLELKYKDIVENEAETKQEEEEYMPPELR